MNNNIKPTLMDRSLSGQFNLFGFKLPINMALVGGFFIIMVSGFLFYTKFTKYRSIESHISCVNIEGVVGLKNSTSQSTGISISDSKGRVLYSCYSGECGYKNWRLDIGKQAKLIVCNGVVIDFNVDGQVRKNKHETIGQFTYGIVSNGIVFLLGLIISFYAAFRLLRGR